MLRLLAFLAVLGAAAWGLSWLADNPGVASVTWHGVEYSVSLMVALGIAAAFIAALLIVLIVLQLILRAPSLIALSSRVRRREKGFLALSRGMVAVGAGDAREAQRQSREADRLFAGEPLTKLLRAQAAQLSGDRARAIGAFNDMLAEDETHLLGLRGLHIEARRAAEPEAALDYARRAYTRAAPSWAAQAVLDDYAARGDWANALGAVETNSRAGLIDRPTANRWRAVLKTALAQQRADRDAKSALGLAREALDLAPTLVPAAVICAKLTTAAGDLRKAAKILETAYRAGPHPDLADAYVHLRLGDAAGDRLTRAKALARIAFYDPESILMVARAHLEAQDLQAARQTLAPLLGEGRPTTRACLLMAEIEEATGDDGAVREWLARAARAPRDRAWVAGEIIADRWAPASPSGALDAYQWRTPDERIAAPAPPITLHPASPPPPAPAAVVEPPRADPVLPPPRALRRSVSTPLIANAPDDPGPPAQDFRGFAVE